MAGVEQTIVPDAAAGGSPTPPIVEIFQFLYKFAGAGLGFLWTATAYLYSALRTASLPVTAIVSALYAPLSYILAPFVLSVTILVNAFVITPYEFLKALLHDVYPLYAFVVVSLIYAGGIGLCARIISRLGMSALTEPSNDFAPGENKSNPDSKEGTQSHTRRVTIKDERS